MSFMQVKEALEKANQILEEERQYPTVTYEDSGQGAPGILGDLDKFRGWKYLNSVRSKRPREVLENSRRFTFESTNYNLLLALLNQLPEQHRAQFIQSILLRTITLPGCCLIKQGSGSIKQAPFPGWGGLTSELPLIAEFAIRNSGAKHLFQILGKAEPLPGHVVLLRHLEEMIALNFTVLIEKEYQHLSLSIGNFAMTARGELEKYSVRNATDAYFQNLGTVNMKSALYEITAAAQSIQEQCRKAQYLYLKGALLEGLNLEINQDKEAVQNYLQRLGFTQTLIYCLNKADQLYQEPADAFDQKSSMGHLRSFLESLHAEALESISAGSKPPADPSWGCGLTFLRQKELLSEKEERFAAGLYGLISDEAVHPLIAEREYARLTRNMVIEYGLLFLRKLEKSGLRVKP